MLRLSVLTLYYLQWTIDAVQTYEGSARCPADGPSNTKPSSTFHSQSLVSSSSNEGSAEPQMARKRDGTFPQPHHTLAESPARLIWNLYAVFPDETPK